jgi:O-antigen/teichoic acid export membrane protein
MTKNKYFLGAAAMVVEKIIKMLCQLATVILLARFIGAEKLGLLMYCLAFSSLFIFLNQLGLDTLFIKKIIEFPNRKKTYLMHALILRCGAAILCILIINFIGLFLLEGMDQKLLFIVSLYHILLPFSVFEWMFQAEGRGELAAIGLISGHLLSFLFRLLCLTVGGDLLWLGLSYVLELAVIGTVYIFIYKVRGGITYYNQFSLKISKKLLREATPLMISSAVTLLYMKLDQIMLGRMVGEAEVGIYVAGYRLSEAWYFLGLTIISVYFPKILHKKNVSDYKAYIGSLIGLGRWLFWGGVLLAFIVTPISDQIISVLFGDEFRSSAVVLMISIWAVPFVYLGGVSTKIYVAESKFLAALSRSIFGLLVNIGLNLLLIGEYGAIGAAIATVSSQVLGCYIFNALLSSGKIFSIQTSIIFPVPNYESKVASSWKS